MHVCAVITKGIFMKFKKINEHTVECFITEQDLADNGLTLEDLIKDPKKTDEFVHKVVSISRQEVDFQPDSSVLQAQIMPYDGGIVMLVFDKPTEKLGEYLLSQLKKKIFEALHMNNGNNKEEGHLDDDEISEELEALMNEGLPGDRPEGLAAGDERCYLFPSFENLMDFVRKCDPSAIRYSHLYYQDGTYFCIFAKSDCSDEEYAEFCDIAEEYGYMSADNDARIQLIKEHTSPLIATEAIEVLKLSIR